MSKHGIDTWPDLVDDVNDRLGVLADGAFVVYALPGDAFVQYACIGEQIHAEVVGATTFGGYMDQPDPMQQSLRALGWLDPTQQPPQEAPMWSRPDASPDDVEFGTLTMQTLQALGCDDPREVTIDTGP